MPGKLHKVKRIKKRYEKAWLQNEGIIAVGIGKVDNAIGIVISVESKSFADDNSIPADIEGVPVKIQEIGTIRAF